MKVGVIADIHGNHFALEKVLSEAEDIGVNYLLVLGDIVGYYYHPEKVLDMLERFPYEIIKGNHEIILEDLKCRKIESDVLKQKYGRGHEIALQKLNEKTLQWLFSLPIQRSVVVDNVSFQMNHGSPWSVNEYLYPDTDKEKLDRCNTKDHDFVLIGHSHYPFVHRCVDSTIINCGSVGQSRKQGGIANWAIINTVDKTCEIKNTPYNTSQLLKELKDVEEDFTYALKVLVR